MFRNTLRELDRLSRGRKIAIPIEADAEGYVDKECPSCQCSFKVHGEDWANIVSDEGVFCAFCGHEADSDQWWTTGQIEQASKQAQDVYQAQIERSLNQAMRRDAALLNRRQRGGFIQMKMNVTSAPSSAPPTRSISADDPMRFKVTCPKCDCRYAVVGVAFFCPACGHNAADMMFGQALDGILQGLDATNNVRHAIANKDTAENTVRTMVEAGLQNAVTAFQRYVEALYHTVSDVPPRRNAFQNLNRGEDLWRTATGKSYADYLTNGELDNLNIYFQRRHLLAHTQGIVDQDYVSRSGDVTYKIGQRLVVRENEVRRCVDIIKKLADGLKAGIPR